MTDPSAADRGESAKAETLEEVGARRAISPAARRALEEARERRRADADAPTQEIGGRGGLDPARYGDWEVKGLASDF
jgi:hypothetical protein